MLQASTRSRTVSRLSAVACGALAVLALAAAAIPARAQQPASAALDAKIRVPDSLHSQVIELRDGSSLVGRITTVGTDTVTFATAIAVIAIPRSAISSVREIRNPIVSASGQVWLPDPGITRLMFAPTGRMLEKGDGYFSDAYLLMLGFFSGVTDRMTIGGGMSIIPSDDFFRNNAYYLMPKIGVMQSERINIAVGGLVGTVPSDEGASGGIGYGVATFGPPQGNFTVGVGYGFDENGIIDRPLLMLGFYNRLSRRTAFVSENYALPGQEGLFYSYGLRFFGEKLSVDFAFWNVTNSGFQPGVPYVAFAKHF